MPVHPSPRVIDADSAAAAAAAAATTVSVSRRSRTPAALIRPPRTLNRQAPTAGGGNSDGRYHNFLTVSQVPRLYRKGSVPRAGSGVKE